MTKKPVRFRTLIRQGWHYVELPGYVPEIDDYWYMDKASANRQHYKQMTDWCTAHLPTNSWNSRINLDRTTGQAGKKMFVFKEGKHATWFTLLWSNPSKTN